MRRFFITAALAAVGTFAVGSWSSAATIGWHLVAMGNRGSSYGSEVFAVSSSSGAGVWAVGRSDAPNGQGVIWRAAPASGGWGAVAVPHQMTGEYFNDVGTWGTNVWVLGVGRRVDQWTGSKWVDHSPTSLPAAFNASAILANGTTSVWIVGGDDGQPAAAHWDGSKWTLSTARHFAGVGFSGFQSIAAIPGTDQFVAAGIRNAQACEGGKPMAEFWNGSSWSNMSLPAPAGSVDECNFEPNPALNNEWLTFPVGTGATVVPYVLHRVGNAWVKATMHTPSGSTYWDVSGIDGSSTSNVWAAGFYYLGPAGTGRTRPLLEHWNGTRWSVVAAPADSTDSYLNGISYVPGTCQVDAVGGYKHSSTANSLPFDERYC